MHTNKTAQYKKIFDVQIPASMIRQYAFCPRIPYYRFFLGRQNRSTPWMKQGEQLQSKLEELLKRRKLDRFGMPNGELRYNVRLFSKQWGILGVADTLLINGSHVAPLEIKLSGGPPVRGAQLQLLAYGLMAEEQLDLRFERGFFLFGKKAGRVYVLENTEERREDLKRTLVEIQKLMRDMTKPDSPASQAKCVQCEHLLECNDRDL